MRLWYTVPMRAHVHVAMATHVRVDAKLTNALVRAVGSCLLERRATFFFTVLRSERAPLNIDYRFFIPSEEVSFNSDVKLRLPLAMRLLIYYLQI